ncbi:MAG: flippase [Acidobacteriaceae bacterium]|nr:flippase [Acidobacteriaceae bacterium]
MNRRRILRENIASLAGLQLVGYIAPLLTVPYLVRVLKPAEFGLLSFAQGVVLYFDLITDYGFNLSATRGIAAQRNEPDSVSRIFWSTLCAKAILMLLCGAALALLVAFIPRLRENSAVYAVSFLYVIGTVFFPVWLFQGLERMKLAAFALGTARILTVPALFLFVRSERDCVVAAAIQASVQAVASILVIPALVGMRLRWYRPSLADLASAFKRGWPLFISGSALYLCTSSTTVVLGFCAGKSAVGYYSAADKLIKAATSLLSPISQALYPHITALKVTSTTSALRMIRKSFLSIGLLSLCTSILTLVLARPICHLFLGPSFEGSIAVLQCLSPLPVLFGLMSVLGTQTMLVFEMDDMMSRIMFGSALAGIPLTMALSSLFGAEGAAAASVMLAIVMLGAMMIVLKSSGLPVWQEAREGILA